MVTFSRRPTVSQPQPVLNATGYTQLLRSFPRSQDVCHPCFVSAKSGKTPTIPRSLQEDGDELATPSFPDRHSFHPALAKLSTQRRYSSLPLKCEGRGFIHYKRKNPKAFSLEAHVMSTRDAVGATRQTTKLCQCQGRIQRGLEGVVAPLPHPHEDKRGNQRQMRAQGFQCLSLLP